MSDENKKIEIISGNGSDLNISPVYDHLNAAKPKTERPKDIVIPKVKKDISKKQEKKNG